VTARRNIIIAVGAIVIFAAIVGFFITLDVSPQIAYARLFIDLGLSIGLMAVIMAFYRDKPLALDALIQTLKKLSAGKYRARITVPETDQLAPVAKAINELAKHLETEHNKLQEQKRNLREELLPGVKTIKEPTLFDHSIHPELGPVVQLPEMATAEPKLDQSEAKAVIKEQKYSNPLIESKPPAAPTALPHKGPAIAEQDLGELYQRFIDAQRQLALDQTEYPAFLKTIEATRKELLNSFQCRDVVFDVVSEQKQVALQPRIVR
jgi:HAMP domain-containing protein